MLLWACPVSLLGLAYLLLLACLLLAPPARGRYAERDARRRFLEPPSRAPAAILNHQCYRIRIGAPTTPHRPPSSACLGSGVPCLSAGATLLLESVGLVQGDRFKENGDIVLCPEPCAEVQGDVVLPPEPCAEVNTVCFLPIAGLRPQSSHCDKILVLGCRVKHGLPTEWRCPIHQP